MCIPYDSWLRNSDVTQGSTNGITTSGIEVGDYLVVRNSNVGNSGFGLTSLQSDNSVCGVGNSYLDNIYRVAAAVGVQTSAIGFGGTIGNMGTRAGVGSTTVTRVTVSVSSTQGISGIGNSNFYGEFSWGKIVLSSRAKSQAFTVNTTNGLLGIETGPRVQRVKPLRIENYDT